MFDLHFKANGEKLLKYTDRNRYSGERGMWVEICHENDKECKFLLDFNRKFGLQVERDEKGFYRALVLKD
jgi:hypothetical protein